MSEKKEEEETGFLDHLEELRWHIIRSLIAIGVLTVVSFIFMPFLFEELILWPSRASFPTYRFMCAVSENINLSVFCLEEDLALTLQSRKMTGQFTMHITVSFSVGFIASFPYFFYEIWRFIRPGLYAHEQRAVRGATFWVSLLFFMGIAFGYFVLYPITMKFLVEYRVFALADNVFDITSFLGTFSALLLAAGILFELPVFMYFLGKAGIVSSVFLKQYRRHAIVIMFVLAAMITPPDVLSQFLMAIPTLALYELSIFLVKRIEKNNLKRIENLSDE